jgi:hypothetical protein
MTGHGMRNVHPILTKMCDYIDRYNKLCTGCPNERSEAETLYNECNNLYILAVNSVFPTHSKTLMSKLHAENSLTFYKDGKHIKTVTR